MPTPSSSQAAAKQQPSSTTRWIPRAERARQLGADWKCTEPAGRRHDRFAGRRADPTIPRSPTSRRRRRRTSCWKCQDHARWDRPRWPADNNSIPRRASGQCPGLQSLQSAVDPRRHPYEQPQPDLPAAFAVASSAQQALALAGAGPPQQPDDAALFPTLPRVQTPVSGSSSSTR